MLTYNEIVQKCTPDQINNRDFASIAATVSIGRTAVKEYWLTDRGLVSDLMLLSGSLDMSDAILTKLEVLAEQSRSMKAIINRLTTDPKGINFGDTGMRAQISYLTPAVFTETERDMLLSLAVQPDPVTVHEVQSAMEGL